MTAMALQSLLAPIALGEDFTRQFKADARNAELLASEMTAFVDTGGMVLSGHCGPISDRLSMEPAA
jgi:hypothetical protein